MKVVIKGAPKEIADLVVALQGQRKPPRINVELDGKKICSTNA